MKFLATSVNTGDPTAHLEAETARITELTETGALEWMLLKADRSGAVLLLNADDPEGARTVVDSLPIAAAGLTEFSLTAVVEPPR